MAAERALGVRRLSGRPFGFGRAPAGRSRSAQGAVDHRTPQPARSRSHGRRPTLRRLAWTPVTTGHIRLSTAAMRTTTTTVERARTQ